MVNLKAIQRTFFTLLAISLFASNSLAQESEVKHIPSSQYFETTLNEINQAKESIQVFMYLISVFPDQPESQANQLIQALIKAKERGVDVRVTLDQNINFQDETNEQAIYQNKNQQAFEFLKRNGIEVYFDEADTYTHAKVIVIDNETVILGSTNWSKAALTKNHEANTLIRSKEFAQSLLKDMATIKLQETPPLHTPSVLIPKAFLLKENLLGEMVSQADERTFGAYLHLLSQYAGNETSKVTLSYDKLASSLGIGHMPKEDYRRQINKVLTKLRDKYKLIEFQNPQRNQDVEIALKDPGRINSLYKLSEEDAFQFPTTYWKHNWNKTLSYPAKAMYLIVLSYTSPQSPSFFMSRETLSKKHHISESFISDGTKELRRLNLLDIQYGDLEGKTYNQRLANVYTPKPLYNPQDLKKTLKDLEEKHGKEKLERAQQIAAIIFEENNPRTIQTLIDLEDKYGKTILQEASEKIAQKAVDNPKRSAGYLINTAKAIAKQKEPTLI